FTTCWPGVRLFRTSSPSARARTCATNSLTTPKLTSASRRARRTSRMAREIASSSRTPRPRRSPRALWSFSLSVSNIGRRVAGRSVRLAAVRGGIACIAAVAVLLLAACGGGGGGGTTTTQLSPTAYRAAIAKVKTEAAKAQSDVGQGLQAKTPDELKQRVDAFAAATQRIGDEVAALKPPENAIAANTELAQGLHDIAAGTRAASAKIAKL